MTDQIFLHGNMRKRYILKMTTKGTNNIAYLSRKQNPAPL